MPHFFFHVRRNGELTTDEDGRQFDDARQAVDYAIQAMPLLLVESLQPANTYVTTEVCSQTQTICVVRGAIITEMRDPQ